MEVGSSFDFGYFYFFGGSSTKEQAYLNELRRQLATQQGERDG
jgi:hypothetical protein